MLAVPTRRKSRRRIPSQKRSMIPPSKAVVLVYYALWGDRLLGKFRGGERMGRTSTTSSFSSERASLSTRLAQCSSRSDCARSHPAYGIGDSARPGPQGYPWSGRKPELPRHLTLGYLSSPSHSPATSIRGADRQPIRYRTTIRGSKCLA